MTQRHRLFATIDALRRGLKWVVVILAPILLIGVVGVSIASHWKQYRVYSAFGISVAMDKHILVVEREFPAGYGYRAVGTATEIPTSIGRGWYLAINDRPFDSEVRKWRFRHFVPQAGSLRSPSRHGCRWVSTPSWLCAAALVLICILSYRETVGRPPHCCRRCGYDLRGISQSVPCPECGTIPPSRASEAEPL